MELKKINVKDIGALIGSMGLGVALGLALCKIISALWLTGKI